MPLDMPEPFSTSIAQKRNVLAASSTRALQVYVSFFLLGDALRSASTPRP